ncbi:class I SAM-dependent methyltransferase [Streptomyces sp. NPDC050485]|uniref:class I SAM-dependent methyltransferase n=1 Tax=Streptomyces sp. NPDC050485 TaxID=3365617 RepID=UPI0037A908C6
MLDYDVEAARYDATRGGVPRAEAAAAAVLGLVPGTARTLLDIGCGTGLVTQRLNRPGLRVYGADASAGMARVAAARVGPRIVLADVGQLPFPVESLDAVSAVWLLHLARNTAHLIVAEAARVLKPGGVFIATVDKDVAHDVGSDIDTLLTPHRTGTASDQAGLIESYAARHGLTPVAEAHFRGHGQGRTPLAAADTVRRGRFTSWLTLTGPPAEQLAASLAALPDPERPRADPEYRLLALRKGA